ncbi:DUF1326 domain-containing protein [Streptomyces sp. NPDC006670]|uniref:DUF1326 domain-containing protein n=1 Tax=Streptomyces sp. NPDC006670 TaxID=3154476 RepID=UPI0033F364C8
MAWRIEGTYFENCGCDMVCPCATSGLSAPADSDRCQVVLAFHIDAGRIDDVAVDGLTVAVVADTPQLMSEGNWRMGMFMDEAASPEQAEALGAVFSGGRGGPMEGLRPLVGEMLGLESARIEYVDDGRRHRVRIGDAIELEVEDFVSPLDSTGKGVRVSGVGFPADTLAAGTATRSRVNAFGLAFENEGKNAFSAPFSWAA